MERRIMNLICRTACTTLLFAALILFSSCKNPEPMPAAATSRGVSEAPFGQMPDGEAVELFTLKNANGMTVEIASYGATITSIQVPDRDGNMGEVTLGFDNLESYLGGHPFFGVVAGRYANRIANGQFRLNGQVYDLAKNNGPNHLHGGLAGFDKKLWDATSFDNADGIGVALTYVSPDGEEGYPGTLTSKVTYTLTDDNTIQIDYEARTDAPTVINLTNHAYFNLKDAGASTILGHEIEINADQYIPTDDTNIPLGPLADVAGTPFDLRAPVAIGAGINKEDEQIKFGFGYDHTFVINRESGGLVLAAEVYEPTTGRMMEVLTTEPGVQFYTGNHLDGSLTGKDGVTFQRRTGFCLETQHYPDSPNQPDYPSTVLRPGQTYRSTTAYRFSVR